VEFDLPETSLELFHAASDPYDRALRFFLCPMRDRDLDECVCCMPQGYPIMLLESKHFELAEGVPKRQLEVSMQLAQNDRMPGGLAAAVALCEEYGVLNILISRFLRLGQL